MSALAYAQVEDMELTDSASSQKRVEVLSAVANFVERIVVTVQPKGGVRICGTTPEAFFIDQVRIPAVIAHPATYKVHHANKVAGVRACIGN